jgi:hypothetical protein
MNFEPLGNPELLPAVVPVSGLAALPPVLAGSMTSDVRERVGEFYNSIAAIFEAWVGRRKSGHTRRAYRGDVMAFAGFMGWHWPDDAVNLLRTSISREGE